MSDDRVRVRNDSGTRIRGGPAGVSLYDGDIAEMAAEHAPHYVDNYGFTIIAEGPFADEDEDEDGADEGDASDADAEDVDEWEAWNEDDWLDLDYQQRADDVREGRVDDYLGQIEASETSETVEEAVAERRAELSDDADESEE